MNRSILKALQLLLAVTVVASLYVACGSPHKCSKSSDCKTGEKCQTDAKTKLRSCVKEDTGCKADSDCKSDEECKAGKCEKKATGGCKADSECAAGEECKAGKCEKKTDPPPGCTADSDCKADEECKAGKCEKKPTTGCKADGDCKADEECKAGKCEKKPPPGCTDNSGCSGATPVCNLGTKQCVECIADSDCKDNKTCKDNKCDNGGGGGCKSDADCNNGETCTNPGPNGKCETKPGTKDVGESCSQTDGCKAGLDCIPTASGGADPVCFQPCAADADCASNPFRNACIAAGTKADGSPLQLCLRRSKKDEACGFKSAKKEQGLCEGGQTPPLYCSDSKKTCQPVKLQGKEGDSCTKQGVSADPPEVCDSSKGIACDEASGTCKKAKIAKEGEECDGTGANNGGEKILCDTGLTCIRFDSAGTLQRCHRTCDAKGTGAECTYKDTTCEPLLNGGAGLCFDVKCTTDAECTFPNNRCTKRQDGSAICFPKPASGPVKFGGLCKTPIKQFGCDTAADPAALCLQASQMATQGFCSRNCTQDNKCPEWTDGTNKIPSTCVAVDSMGTKYCLFNCGQPNQKCPTGLTCQTIGGGAQTCLAP